jgi:hypothetical protein
MCKIHFFSKQLQLLLIIIIAAGILISSLHYAKALNMYHGELDIYLPHYLANNSILKIVFDPVCELDLSQKTFRGREVGNFFNLIDAKLLTYLFSIKIPAFISVVYYLSIVAIIISVILLSSKIYKNREVLSGLLLLSLLSSPPIVLGGLFYRTNKIIAGSAVVICIFLLELLKKNVLRPNNQILSLSLLFLISLIACLSDEQGFMIVAIIGLWELFVVVKNKNYIFKIAPFLLITSVLLSVCYKGFIGPEIFENVIGIKVSTQNIGNIQTLTDVNNFFSSFLLLIKYISYVFGNLNLSITSFFGLILIAKLYQKSYSEKFLHVVYVLLTLTALIHIMTLKHPAILWPESITYYSLPIVCLAFAYSFTGLHNNIRLFGNEYLPHYFLVVLIVLNIFSWNKSFDKIANGHIKPFRVADKIISAVYDSEDQTKKILAEISLKTESPGYNPEFKFGENGISALKESLLIKKER